MDSSLIRKYILVVVSLLLQSTTYQVYAQEKSEATGVWETLFDGKNLDQWLIQCAKEDKDRNFWSIKDGIIVANSMGSTEHGYVWLQTNKEYADFELHLKFQSYRESPGNSGVQIRSRYDFNAQLQHEKSIGWLDGPQVDIHPNGAWRTGYIYDETRGLRRWINPSLPDWRMDRDTHEPKIFKHYFSDEEPFWNDLVIICKGNNIKAIVNGIVVSNYDGTGVLDDAQHQKYNITTQGFIALQIHKNDQLKIGFKDIKIREL